MFDSRQSDSQAASGLDGLVWVGARQLCEWREAPECLTLVFSKKVAADLSLWSDHDPVSRRGFEMKAPVRTDKHRYLLKPAAVFRKAPIN